MAESINQYEIAAVERLFNGLAVAVCDGRESSRGGAYLFGYVVEMTLKAAFFRVNGANPAAPVRFSSTAKAVNRSQLSASEAHDIRLLRDALLNERAKHGLLLDPLLTLELNSRTERVSRLWSVDMRYDGSPMPTTDIGQMFEDASWLVSQRLALTQ